MKRMTFYPILSASLLGMWLLLNQSISPGHVFLGSVLGIAGGFALSALQLPAGRVHRPAVALELAFLVLVDIIRSNFVVASIILTPGRGAQSRFLAIPLELRNHYGLAVLACIITSTPGTVWVKFNSTMGILQIHVLDLVDEAAWRSVIKNRYERRLMEIFE
jgi:multicomponent K+:H+ antiporter subunit E